MNGLTIRDRYIYEMMAYINSRETVEIKGIHDAFLKYIRHLYINKY